MEEKDAIVQNTEEAIEEKTEEIKAEDMTPAADSVMDDDIQYTFVVPKGEIYRDPDDEIPEQIPEPEMVDPEPAEEAVEEPEAEEEPESAKTIVVEHKRFTDAVNDALAEAAEADAEEEFFKTYKAADPTGRTVFIDPPVYDETGLAVDDDITYTFVVPKGEIYKEPDPEEERAAKEAEKARRAAARAAAAASKGNVDILTAETKVMERKGGEGKTRYGLPANHPEMGELAKKQEERRRYNQRKKNRFRTRFYVLMTSLILLVCWLILSNSGIFTIDAIEVRGNSHYTAEEIINIGHATSGRNIIYKANIKETTEFLEQNPYIRHAEVRRKLPSTLVIKVTEREERLAFRYDDDYLIMDEDGILLRKTRNKPKVTIVEGVVVSKIKLGEKTGTEKGNQMDDVLELIKTMIKSDMFFVKIDISNEKSIKAYIYDTLVVKTDHDTLITNLENGRLHLVVEKLFEDGIKRGTITIEEDGAISFMPIF